MPTDSCLVLLNDDSRYGGDPPYYCILRYPDDQETLLAADKVENKKWECKVIGELPPEETKETGRIFLTMVEMAFTTWRGKFRKDLFNLEQKY